jgi:hypothetical protein
MSVFGEVFLIPIYSKGTKIYNRPTALPCRHEKTAIIDATRGATFANQSLRNRVIMVFCKLYIYEIWSSSHRISFQLNLFIRQRSKVVTAFDSNVQYDIKSLRGRRFESCRCRFFAICI